MNVERKKRFRDTRIGQRRVRAEESQDRGVHKLQKDDEVQRSAGNIRESS